MELIKDSAKVSGCVGAGDQKHSGWVFARVRDRVELIKVTWWVGAGGRDKMDLIKYLAKVNYHVKKNFTLKNTHTHIRFYLTVRDYRPG